jgi:hypothetical protein
VNARPGVKPIPANVPVENQTGLGQLAGSMGDRLLGHVRENACKSNKADVPLLLELIEF